MRSLCGPHSAYSSRDPVGSVCWARTAWLNPSHSGETSRWACRHSQPRNVGRSGAGICISFKIWKRGFIARTWDTHFREPTCACR